MGIETKFRGNRWERTPNAAGAGGMDVVCAVMVWDGLIFRYHAVLYLQPQQL